MTLIAFTSQIVQGNLPIAQSVGSVADSLHCCDTCGFVIGRMTLPSFTVIVTSLYTVQGCPHNVSSHTQASMTVMWMIAID